MGVDIKAWQEMAMAVQSRPVRILVTLACFLTVAASGDDFNFLRVALPAAFAGAPVGSLPLDDETADFVTSPRSSANMPTVTLDPNVFQSQAPSLIDSGFGCRARLTGTSEQFQSHHIFA